MSDECFFCYDEVYHPEFMQPAAVRQIKCWRHKENTVISAEFTCECGAMKGWITEDKITPPCPGCGSKYRGEYSEEKLTIVAKKIIIKDGG